MTRRFRALVGTGRLVRMAGAGIAASLAMSLLTGPPARTGSMASRIALARAVHASFAPGVIDPEIAYSTYLGGTDLDVPTYSAVDRFGDLYLVGWTLSTDFPTTPGAYQPSALGNVDAFVTKLSHDGTKVIYSTYLGGGGEDYALALDVDRAGNAYVTGETTSVDFPITVGAYQTANAGGLDAFATKLNPSGSALVYSTYVGGAGDDGAGAGPIDRGGNIYLQGTTLSSDFPVTKDAFQTTFAGGDGERCVLPCDAFVTKLNRAGSALVYSSYLGGSGDEICCFGAVDRMGHAYTTGFTDSTDFPTTPGAFQTAYGGGRDDTFVTKVNGKGSGLVFSTYLGGTGTDFPNGLTIDHEGNTFVAGATDSTDYPTTPGVFQGSNAGGLDGTLTKLNPIGSDVVYSTYIGGTGEEYAGAVQVDGAGDAYVPGVTTSTDFPVTEDAIQPSFAGGDGALCFGLPCDALLFKLNADASALLFSTYLGGTGDDWSAGQGLGLDGSGNAYVPGYTTSVDFPTSEEAFQPAFDGVVDGFATKIEFGDGELRPQAVRRGPPTSDRGGWGLPDPWPRMSRPALAG